MSQPIDQPAATNFKPIESPQLTPDDLIPVAEYAQHHQTAVLVILFTDIKGSTQLTEVHGEQFSRNLRHKHDSMLRKTFERDGAGRLIKTIGDSLMYVFAKPSDAVARSIEAQRQLRDYNDKHPDDPELLVRMGMHMGQVLVEKDVDIDVFGRHVNRAARVESLADGGQILVTHSVYDSARGWLASELLTWHDHGDYLLKGIPEATRIVEVCLAGQKPQRPPGARVTQSRWHVWLSLAVLALGLAWLYSPKPAPSVPRLPTIGVNVLRGDDAVLPLKEATPLVTGDKLRIRAEFHKPAYAAILLVDENGTAEIIKTSGKQRVSVLEEPAEIDEWLPVSGDKGVEMLIALEGSKPITQPPEIFQKGNWKLPKTSTSNETIWISPIGIQTEKQNRNEEARGLGKAVKHETKDLHLLIDQVRKSLADESYRFHAVVYPHEDR